MDVVEGDAVFGDRDRTSAYFVHAKQMANFVGMNSIAIRLGRKRISVLRQELKADDRIDLLRGGGDWIGVRFGKKDDVVRIVELMSLAAADCRPLPRRTG